MLWNRNKAVEFRIGPYTVLMDEEDAERASHYKWEPIEDAGELILFFTNIGTFLSSHYLLLHNFAAGAPEGVYAEFIDRSKEGLDCRRANLRLPEKGVS